MIYGISILSSLVFAVIYAVFEHWFEYSKTTEWFSFLQMPVIFNIFRPYHYIWMLSIFLFVGSLPLLSLILFDAGYRLNALMMVLGNLWLIILIEDIAFFLFLGRWIVEGDWNTRLFGYFTYNGVVIPRWYPILLICSSICYFYSFHRVHDHSDKKIDRL